ncbi:MAG: DUF2214 family protein [Cyclobacteriaceae bacterium]|nr:DUF2214 family protein [Cyclobacteriaceae bacterium]
METLAFEIALRYTHFISILLITGALAAEWILMKPELTRSELKRLSRIDAIYGVAAVLVVTAGLMLWLLGVSKPETYYTHNWVFLTKIGIFITVGTLSVFPTVFFIKRQKGRPEEVVPVPAWIRRCISLELLLLAAIPLCASLMARGYGYIGN